MGEGQELGSRKKVSESQVDFYSKSNMVSLMSFKQGSDVV